MSSSNPAGYALIEMLVAAAIGCALLGVLAQFALAAQASVAAQGEATDLQQRLRTAVEVMRRDLLRAGAGPALGAGRGPLVSTFAPVLPARTGAIAADAEMSFHDDRLSVTYVPESTAQTRLTADTIDRAAPLAVDGSVPGCPPASACGFARNDDALIFEPAGAGAAHEIFNVAAVDAAAGTLTPSLPLSRVYPRGSRVVRVIQRTYYLDRAGRRLMVYDGARSDVPLVDHVSDLRFTLYADPRVDAVAPPVPGAGSCACSPPASLMEDLGGAVAKPLAREQLTDGPVCGLAPYRFDADLLRLRRVVFTIRLEAESAEFRGRGALFSAPGFSRGGVRYVPDLQATIDVAPRNLAR